MPGELGFYDLRMPEIREAQAALAEAHGIAGFCYYHYWFNGRRILERPFNEVLTSGSPDFPFCLCWANEPWTRNWDGGSRETLIAQRHSIEDDRRHIQWLIRAFRDERYIRVGDRPVFFVYNVPGAATMPAPRWSSGGRSATRPVSGIPYLVRFDTFGNGGDPALHGCDAAAEFLPHGVYDTMCARGIAPVARTSSGIEQPDLPLRGLVASQLARPLPAWTRYQCVIPNWDNTPRKPQGSANLFLGLDTGELRGLASCGRCAKAAAARHEFVLINAWNEWAEGTHLEPDVELRPRLPGGHRPGGRCRSRREFDLDGVHRGRTPRRREEDRVEIDISELYEEHKASSAREIEALLSEIQELRGSGRHELREAPAHRPRAQSEGSVAGRTHRARWSAAAAPAGTGTRGRPAGAHALASSDATGGICEHTVRRPVRRYAT